MHQNEYDQTSHSIKQVNVNTLRLKLWFSGKAEIQSSIDIIVNIEVYHNTLYHSIMLRPSRIITQEIIPKIQLLTNLTHNSFFFQHRISLVIITCFSKNISEFSNTWISLFYTTVPVMNSILLYSINIGQLFQKFWTLEYLYLTL